MRKNDVQVTDTLPYGNNYSKSITTTLILNVMVDVCHRIETSQLIYSANQLTAFYMLVIPNFSLNFVKYFKNGRPRSLLKDQGSLLNSLDLVKGGNPFEVTDS